MKPFSLVKPAALRIWTRLHSCARSWMAAVWCCSAVCQTAAVATAQAPLEVIPVTLDDNGLTVEMVLMPAGEIAVNTGSAAGDGASVGESDRQPAARMVAIKPFYISSTEITFAQLLPVVGAERAAEIRQRVQSTTGAESEETRYLRDALDSPDMPAFSLTLEDIVVYCRVLTERAGTTAAGQSYSIEAKRFRIPTRDEWRYACQADLPDALTAYLNRWTELDALPRDVRAKIEEACQSTGKSPESLQGSQQEIFALLDELLGGDPGVKQSGQRILSDYFVHCLGIERDFTKQSYILKPVGISKPNNWNMSDMHDNVAEWAVAIDDPASFDSWWKDLQSAGGRQSALERPCLVLLGGGFAQSASERGTWRQFAISGGYPFNPQSGELAPIHARAAFDGSPNGIAADMNPGLRLVMERSLRDDWFAQVRMASYSPQTPAALLGQQRTILAEVATAAQQGQVTPYLDAYEGLVLARSGDTARGMRMLRTAVAGFQASSEQPAQSAADELLSLLSESGASASDGTGASASPQDQAYFALVAELTEG
jgi:formylglycine-generating enzyme required for sulfatase activity